jgi:hypothetical protein
MECWKISFFNTKAVHAKFRLVYVTFGVLLSANGVLLSEIFYNFLLLEFLCLWSCTVVEGFTVEFLYILKKYLKHWGSNVVEVLLFLEFYCLWSSTVSIPGSQPQHHNLPVYSYLKKKNAHHIFLSTPKNQ